MGYKTVDAGKNGMWEMEGVPVESFSTAVRNSGRLQDPMPP
jgi:hypothetical protein